MSQFAASSQLVPSPAPVHTTGPSAVVTKSAFTARPFALGKLSVAAACRFVGSSPYQPANARPAAGTAVRVGTVAVDKRVIPLGTKMYIVTNDGIVYGTAVAEDTGVRGDKVDLYFETYQQCINFGRRGCTVYILK